MWWWLLLNILLVKCWCNVARLRLLLPVGYGKPKLG